MTSRNLLPREIAPGLFWLGDCLHQRYQGKVLHAYDSVYLVCGEECSLLVEAGHPQDLSVIEDQLAKLIAAGAPELRYIFPTHQETPHCSGIGRLLSQYEQASVCGDVSDYHLVFPEHEARLMTLRPGEALDLGGTSFVVQDAVIKDLQTTRWGYDTRRGVLFPGDGFAYSHYHEADHCGKVAEEVAFSLDVEGMTALFAELALYWTTLTDMEPYIERLDNMLDELEVQIVAPTHGLPITDLEATMPRIREGIRIGSGAPSPAYRI